MAVLPRRAPAPRIFAASSLTDALGELCSDYSGGSNRFALNFASSATLARQILSGADAEIFIAADPQWSRLVAKQLRIGEENIVPVASNRLVIASATCTESSADPAALLLKLASYGKIAVGDQRVPVGRYTLEALHSLGCAERLDGNLIHCQDARSILAVVDRGEAAAGVIYQSDALAGRSTRILCDIPPALHTPVVYEAALLRHHTEAADFMKYLKSARASTILDSYGFAALPRRASAGNVASFATDPALPLLSVVWLSFRVAALATAVASILALPLAWQLARNRFRGRSILIAALQVPLALPPVIVGYALLVLLGSKGPIGSLLEQTIGLSLAFNWKGAAVASAAVAFPLALRAMMLSFEAVDPHLEEVAETMGARRLQVLREVTLPLAAPGIIAGMLLAFMRSLGEFGATITFVGSIAGETRTIPLAIHSLLQSPGGETAALKLMLLSIGFAVGAVVAAEIVGRRLAVTRGG